MTTQGASSSSSGFTHSWKYDVFLNFRGTDTRNNFTGQLYNYLTDKGIKTFMDNELCKGQEISQSLLTAIEGSRISVVVFSQNYASSKWCLDELVKILQCKDSRHQLVLPIFYKVEPADVRNQRGSFAKALARHECKFKDNPDKVLRWRTALTHAANLSGWTFSEGSEFHEIVEGITTHVYKRTHLHVANYAVGIDSRVQDVLKLLDIGECDVRMVGIWGTGGIGKTTIGKAIYNSIAREFEFGCFLADVREKSIPYGGLVNLQNILLSKIPGGKDVKVTDVDEGITLIKAFLSHKRVLLILDDVNQLNQLNKLAGGHDWFGFKSRVIITTRDTHLLSAHRVNRICEVKKLCSKEACELFISNWINGQLANRELVDYENCSDQITRELQSVVHYAQGLPLALEVLGGLLCGRSIDEWQVVLDSCRKVPKKKIQEVLKLSFEALEDPEKEVFLDIACFLKGREMDYVMKALDGSDLNHKFAIKVLVEKALIKIDETKCIWMHDLIEEMGKEIIRQESPRYPGDRSRLWFHEDVYDVLTENTGTDRVKGIIVKLPAAREIPLNAKCFKKMKSLQLFININASFSGEVHYLPNQLRFLDWPGCPLQSLPSNFNPTKLVTFNMPRSRISWLGGGPGGFKSFQHMKSMNLEGCESLTQVPNFSGMFPSLEKICLSCCTSLVELHPSVASLEKLVDFDLEGCCNLTMFPRIDNSTSLVNINLGGCTSLEHFPEIEEKVESLRQLNLSYSGIKELPSSIYNLISLEQLALEDCESLEQFPQSTYDLQQLRDNCPKFVTSTNTMNSGVLPTNPNVADDKYGSIPEGRDKASLGLPKLTLFSASGCNLSETDFLASLDCVSTLKELDLSGNIFVSLPCITKFVSLIILKLDGCKRLREIPEFPPKMTSLWATDCVSLKKIANLSNILEQKESKMIGDMNLANCRKLCHSLAQDVEKMKSSLLINEATLFSLCLSPMQSEFQVVFPASDVPEWFSSQMDFTGRFPFYEFSIDILKHLQLEKTGIAICVAVEKPQSVHNYTCSFQFSFSFNYRSCLTRDRRLINATESGHVFMYYLPLSEVRPLLDSIPLPFTFRVTIESPVGEDGLLPIKSCGVHLVIPPNEDLSIKISKTQIITLVKGGRKLPQTA